MKSLAQAFECVTWPGTLLQISEQSSLRPSSISGLTIWAAGKEADQRIHQNMILSFTYSELKVSWPVDQENSL